MGEEPPSSILNNGRCEMKPLSLVTCLLGGLILLHSFLWAAPGDFECRGAIAHLGRIQATLQEKQRDLQHAQRAQQVAESELRLCEPGGIMTGDKVAECVRRHEAFPTFSQRVAEAETKVGETITEFQETLNTVNRICQ